MLDDNEMTVVDSSPDNNDGYHLIVYFPGTDNPGDEFLHMFDHLCEAGEKVKVIFTHGCEHPEVCNDGINPNLHNFAKRFVSSQFTYNAKRQLVFRNTSPGADKVGIKSVVEIIQQKHSQLVDRHMISYEDDISQDYEVYSDESESDESQSNLFAKQPNCIYLAKKDQQIGYSIIDTKGQRFEGVLTCAKAKDLGSDDSAFNTFKEKYREQIVNELLKKGVIHNTCYDALTAIMAAAYQIDADKAPPGPASSSSTTQDVAEPQDLNTLIEQFLIHKFGSAEPRLVASIQSIIRLTQLRAVADKPISEITLCGYSRGAVTTFEVAKVLQEQQLRACSPLVPVNIVAQEPVPGNISQLPGTNAFSVGDCSWLKNVVHFTGIFATYTGEVEGKQIDSMFHHLAFNQIIPEFSRDTQTSLITIPKKHHWSGEFHAEVYIYLAILTHLMASTTRNNPHIQRTLAKLQAEKHGLYDGSHYRSGLSFPSAAQLQPFYGLNLGLDILCQHADPDHRAPYVSAGFHWDLTASISLLEQWRAAEEQKLPRKAKMLVSFGMTTSETLQLVNEITRVSDILVQENGPEGLPWLQNIANKADSAAESSSKPNSVRALIGLYQQTALWLQAKTVKTSDRYDLVLSLHTQLQFYLRRLVEVKPALGQHITFATYADVVKQNADERARRVERPSESFFNQLFNLSGGSVHMLDEVPEERRLKQGYTEIVRDLQDKYDLSNDAWRNKLTQFSPTAKVIIGAIFDDMNQSALGRVGKLSDLLHLMRCYFDAPMWPEVLPYRPSETVALERAFKQACIQKFGKMLRYQPSASVVSSLSAAESTLAPAPPATRGVSPFSSSVTLAGEWGQAAGSSDNSNAVPVLDPLTAG